MHTVQITGLPDEAAARLSRALASADVQVAPIPQSAGVEVIVVGSHAAVEAVVKAEGAAKLVVMIEAGASPQSLRTALGHGRVAVALPASVTDEELVEAVLSVARDSAELGAGDARTGGVPAGFSPALIAVWRRSLPTFAERVAAVEQAVCEVLCGVLTPESHAAAEHEAHKLAGSLGTFGMPEGSRLARELETRFAPTVALRPSDGSALWVRVYALRRMLDAAAE